MYDWEGILILLDTPAVPPCLLFPTSMDGSLRAMDNVSIPARVFICTYCLCVNNLVSSNSLAVVASPLSELRTSLGQSSTEEEADFLCQVKLNDGIGGSTPFFLRLAAEEGRLLVAFPSSVVVWDVNAVINGDVS
ncbi:hypothetical protein FRC20_007715 [Serendipita sp. 405]|nr:hypothetical protein FRC20_007715 [Serendipita sp. 405]